MFLAHCELTEFYIFLFSRYLKEKYKRENGSVSIYKTNGKTKMKIPGNFFLLRMQCQRHIFTSNEGIKRNGLNTNIKSLLVGHMSITVMCYWNQNKLLFASCSFFSCSYILSFLFTDYFWYCEILPSLLFV